MTTTANHFPGRSPVISVTLWKHIWQTPLCPVCLCGTVLDHFLSVFSCTVYFCLLGFNICMWKYCVELCVICPILLLNKQWKLCPCNHVWSSTSLTPLTSCVSLLSLVWTHVTEHGNTSSPLSNTHTHTHTHTHTQISTHTNTLCLPLSVSISVFLLSLPLSWRGCRVRMCKVWNPEWLVVSLSGTLQCVWLCDSLPTSSYIIHLSAHVCVFVCVFVCVCVCMTHAREL